LVEIKNLTKRYGQHLALDNISFTVDDGEILGFLGPNGAGKTTTMNIMTGYIASTEGDVKIGGVDIVAEPEKAKEQIGYLPETPPVYGDMRVDEYLNFVAAIKKVKSSERKQMISDIKATVHIEDMSRRLIKNLSKGYRQRVGMAQAMIGFPQLIIMDEPTVGLDPKQIIEMRDVIKKLGKKHTVILSSHIMQEVSAVCDRVMIINRGKIVASDTPEKLASSLSQGNKMTARIKGTSDAVISALTKYPVISDVRFVASRETGTVDFELAGEGNLDIREAIFACMSTNNLPILMLKSLDLSLEDIFLQVTGDGQAPSSVQEASTLETSTQEAPTIQESENESGEEAAS